MTQTSPTRQQLLGIVRGAWCEVLNVSVDAIRDDDNFFQRSGDSFAAVLLCLYVQERTGIEVTLPQFLNNPTINGLTSVLCDMA